MIARKRRSQRQLIGVRHAWPAFMAEKLWAAKPQLCSLAYNNKLSTHSSYNIIRVMISGPKFTNTSNYLRLFNSMLRI